MAAVPKSFLSKVLHLIFLKSTKYFLTRFYFSQWELNVNTSTLKREDAALLLTGKNQLPKINSMFSKTAYDILCIHLLAHSDCTLVPGSYLNND